MAATKDKLVTLEDLKTAFDNSYQSPKYTGNVDITSSTNGLVSASSTDRKGLSFTDPQGHEAGWVRSIVYKNGNVGLHLAAQNYKTSDGTTARAGITMTVDKNGVADYDFGGNAGAKTVRNALGASDGVWPVSLLPILYKKVAGQTSASGAISLDLDSRRYSIISVGTYNSATDDSNYIVHAYIRNNSARSWYAKIFTPSGDVLTSAITVNLHVCYVDFGSQIMTDT